MSLSIRSTKSYSGFTPQTIPGLRLWLDAADSNTFTFATGSKISTWADKSGFSYNVVQPTPASQPSRILSAANGLPAVRFQQVNATSLDNTAIAPALGSTPISVFLVEQNLVAPSTAGGPIGFGMSSPNSGVVFSFNSTTNAMNPFTTLSFTSATPRLVYYNRTNTGSGAIGTVNGLVSTVNDNTTGTYTGTFWVGRMQFGYINGDVCEVIIYNTNLTTSERQSVEGYLMRKWGLSSSIPTSHPYRYVPPFLRLLQPTDISSCVAWYDVADQSTITFSSGTSVNLLRDKSGNARDISQATVGQQPLLVSNVIGSNPILRFTQASTTVLSNASAVSAALSNGPASFMLLERNMTAPSGNPGPFGFNAGPNFGLVFQYNAGFTGSFQPYTLTGGQTFTSATGRFDYYNRTNTGSGAIGTVYGTVQTVGDNATGTYSGAFNVGRAPNGYISGDIGELIVYSSNLSQSDRQRLEGYIGWKWGLQGNLPSGHPFKLYRPLIPLFVPSAISGLQLWLDATDPSTLTFSGSNITTWADKSGNGMNMTSTGTIVYNATQRRVELNGATNSFFTGTISSTPLSNPSYVILSRQTTGNGPLFTRQSGEFGYFPQYTKLYLQNGSATWAEIATSPVTNGVDYIHSIVYNTSTVELWLSGSNALSSARTAFTTSALDIGARRLNGTERMTGFIYEFLVFSSPLSTGQRQQLEGYLAWKWGIQSSLPSTHAYYEFRP